MCPNKVILNFIIENKLHFVKTKRKINRFKPFWSHKYYFARETSSKKTCRCPILPKENVDKSLKDKSNNNH